jgi:hypothetical protein
VRFGCSKGQEASTGIVTVPGPTRVLAVATNRTLRITRFADGSGIRSEAKPQEWVGSIEPVVGRLIFGLVQSSRVCVVHQAGAVRPWSQARREVCEADLGPGAGHADLHL